MDFFCQVGKKVESLRAGCLSFRQSPSGPSITMLVHVYIWRFSATFFVHSTLPVLYPKTFIITLASSRHASKSVFLHACRHLVMICLFISPDRDGHSLAHRAGTICFTICLFIIFMAGKLLVI